MGLRSRVVALLVSAVGALAVIGLSGCTVSVPTISTPSSAASPASLAPAASTTPSSPAPIGPLQCADLVDRQEVVTAFTHKGVSPTGTITAITPYDARLTGPVAVAGDGGLACAWAVRTSASGSRAGTLLVQVLPGAASQWGALMYGDGPTTDRREFAGVTAAATCGDPGCGASAVVGTNWVRVDLTIPGIGGTTAALSDESTDVVLDGASPTISRVFRTVQQASAPQLDFPKHVGSTTGTSRCDSILRTSTIAPLLSSSEAIYQPEPLTGQTDSINGAAAHDLGSYSCFAKGLSDTPDSTAELTIAPGQAWAVKAMDGSVYFETAPLRPIRLAGATSAEAAETTCRQGSPVECTTIFSLGEQAIQVSETRNATKIAEAIIAYAR